jgi:uncharacterized protein YceH (UPF0502 family)
LLLRGPQTVGEIKGRTARLCNLESLNEVHETLGHLEENGFVRRLPRQPGRKESRYIHLLCGEPEIADVDMALTTGHGVAMESERIEKVEQDIQTLQNDLAELKRELQEFKKQLE